MYDKESAVVLREIYKVSKQIILTIIEKEREFAIYKVLSITQKYFNEVYLTKDLHHAIELVKGQDCLITGSFYLVGEFLKIMPKIE